MLVKQPTDCEFESTKATGNFYNPRGLCQGKHRESPTRLRDHSARAGIFGLIGAAQSLKPIWLRDNCRNRHWKRFKTKKIVTSGSFIYSGVAVAALSRHHSNGPTLASLTIRGREPASLIKALTIARVPVNEIAEKLQTSRKNIVVYQRLYFDIGRYMDEEAWLASVVFSPSQNSQDPVEFRERHWMAAAFVRGERGLGQAFSPKLAVSPEEREELTSEIKSVLTSRAFEFVSALRTGLIPPNHEDFERFVKMLDVAGRQPVQDDKGSTLWAWLDKLYGAAEEAAQLPENANNIGLQETVGAIRMFRELDAGQAKGPQKVLSW